MASTRKSSADTTYDGFSKEERAAMKDRAEELEASKKRGKADQEQAVLDKIAEMPEQDRALAEWIHAIVKETAPALLPKTWYGMPAYAKDGKVVCFFQGADKFKARYATLGFNDPANLDEGTLWPTSFAITKITAANEKAIRNLVEKAAH